MEHKQNYCIIGRKGKYIQGNKVAYNEITPDGTKKNNLFVAEHTYWFIAKPLKKHDFTKEHVVIREKETAHTSAEKFLELETIIESYTNKGMVVRRNSIQHQSAPLLRHYHAATFENIDDKIFI